MSVQSLIPEIWSKSILRNFEKMSIFADVLNREFTSDLGTGDRVHIPRIAPVEVRDYDENTPLQYDDIQSSTVTLELTEQKYFAVKCGDIAKTQANAPFLSASTKNAAYSIRDTVDKYCAGILADNAGITMGSTATPIQITNGAAPGLLFDLGQKFNENNIPTSGRWIIVPPWYYKKLVLDGINLSAISDTSKVYADGFLGRAHGFDIYISNNVPKDGLKYSIIAGTNESGSLVIQIDKVEELRDRDSFSSLVRGLAVFGAAVTQPTATARVIVADVAA